MTSRLDDLQMEELFAAFGEAHASAGAKARALDAISDGARASARADSRPSGALPSEVSGVRVVAGNSLGAGSRNEAANAPTAPKKRSRRMMRAVRLVAAAACLAALAVGGVAYALPASNVTVTAGDSAIDLGVNCFGITVSATSDDAEVQQAVDEAQVRNLPYDESLGRVIDSLGAGGPEPVSVNVEAGDELARAQMEERAAEIVCEKAPPAPEEAMGADGLEPTGQPDQPDAPGQVPAPDASPDGSQPVSAPDDAPDDRQPGDRGEGEGAPQGTPPAEGDRGVTGSGRPDGR